ncbi:HNH endonuclease signature motif containing protein [Aeromonas sp. QDB02]|uniref:HNH endonuclease signature motif containing protein n=1 Tax=Aeromonas sp. QDB02 TaxID=2990476 RepID=UPI003FA47FEF
MREILEKYDIDGIRFKDGEPDFSEISKGDVEIEPFSDSRSDNFDKADIELAKQKGCSPEDVAKWRKENGYTWHECKDMKTMQKVPSEVHNNIPHSSGISEAKKGTGV